MWNEYLPGQFTPLPFFSFGRKANYKSGPLIVKLSNSPCLLDVDLMVQIRVCTVCTEMLVYNWYVPFFCFGRKALIYWVTVLEVAKGYLFIDWQFYKWQRLLIYGEYYTACVCYYIRGVNQMLSRARGIIKYNELAQTHMPIQHLTG